MMDVTNPDSVRETIFAIARDGARPYTTAGVVQRLRELRADVSASFDSRRDGWIAQIDTIITIIEQM